MTSLLTPPPEHDLPPARAAEIRRAVLRSTTDPSRRRPAHRARLVVAAAAALAVAGVGVGLHVDRGSSVLGSPSPAPSRSSTPGVPTDQVDTDAGPLGEAEAVAVVDELLERSGRAKAGPTSDAPVAAIVLARRTTTELGDGTFVVWTDTRGSTWWSAAVPGVMGMAGPVSGPAVRHPRVPDADHPVLRTVDDLDLNFTWREDEDRPDATARDLYSGNFYLVSDAVDRVEVRITVEGRPGPWFTAPVHEGYAYVPAVAPGRHSTSDRIGKVTRIEDRAFGRDGSLLPIAER